MVARAGYLLSDFETSVSIEPAGMSARLKVQGTKYMGSKVYKGKEIQYPHSEDL